MSTGYKGFDKNLKCKDMQYEVGKEFTVDGEIIYCKNGLHFCENPFDVFEYYSPANSRFCEVESKGKEVNKDDKKVTDRLYVKAEIGLQGIINAGVKLIFDRIKWDNTPATNTGYRSAATNTGSYSAATNTGDQSVATNTGNQSVAANTGYQSATTNTGYQSAATNTGDCSAATNTGDCSAATNTGDCSAATNTGDCSAATNTGDCSAATSTGVQSAAMSTGNCSVAISTGNYSVAIVEGKQSIALATGCKSKAKGKIGCWLILAEWNNKGANIIDVQCVKVDGVIIKPDTFYCLINGKFIEQ